MCYSLCLNLLEFFNPFSFQNWGNTEAGICDWNYSSENSRLFYHSHTHNLSHSFPLSTFNTNTHIILCNTHTAGNTYNIPLAVWLTKNHPQHPPIVFVTPTSGMAIQPSQFVDTNGMVYLPYLNEWKGVGRAVWKLWQCILALSPSPTLPPTPHPRSPFLSLPSSLPSHSLRAPLICPHSLRYSVPHLLSVARCSASQLSHVHQFNPPPLIAYPLLTHLSHRDHLHSNHIQVRVGVVLGYLFVPEYIM